MIAPAPGEIGRAGMPASGRDPPMTLEPLFAASLIVQAHAYSATAALALGVVQLAAPKGTLPHRTVGIVWMMLMLIVATSSAFITHPVRPGDPFWARFSFIHLFTLLTSFGLASGAYFLMRGGKTLKRHAAPLTRVFIGGLVIAGALAFAPGRIMHQVAFGG
jgi:uncharacterized membrane protein